MTCEREWMSIHERQLLRPSSKNISDYTEYSLLMVHPAARHSCLFFSTPVLLLRQFWSRVQKTTTVNSLMSQNKVFENHKLVAFRTVAEVIVPLVVKALFLTSGQ
jgi:hypothetical protein